MEIALWGQTQERWEQEGMPAGVTSGLMTGCAHFGLEGYDAVDLNIGPVPPYATRMLKEDDHEELFVDGWGRTRRALKDGTVRGTRMTMDQYLAFAVRDRQSFADLRRRYTGDPAPRYPADWDEVAARLRSTDRPVTVLNPLSGTFGYYSMLRNWMGTEPLSYLLYDDPGLIDESLECLTEFALALLGKAMREVRFDFYVIHEDMAGKGGPLMGPALFRRFLSPHYRRLIGFLRSHGVELILVDTDGNFEALIPEFLEVGVDGFCPMEVAAGMDPVAMRRRYGTAFSMIGGIDKREIAKGRRAIDRQIEEVILPLLGQGGYIPTIDHSIPPDVSYADFLYYLERKREALDGKG
jgi:uroporphyrinogen decarboxylase